MAVFLSEKGTAGKAVFAGDCVMILLPSENRRNIYRELNTAYFSWPISAFAVIEKIEPETCVDIDWKNEEAPQTPSIYDVSSMPASSQTISTFKTSANIFNS